MPPPVLVVIDMHERLSTRWTPRNAVGSRTPVNLEIGLAQARQAGAVITATETDTDAVRDLGKLLK